MSAVAWRVTAEAADPLGLKHILLFSVPGRDAQSLASVCPVGTISALSVEGASHSSWEFTRWRDCGA